MKSRRLIELGLVVAVVAVGTLGFSQDSGPVVVSESRSIVANFSSPYIFIEHSVGEWSSLDFKLDGLEIGMSLWQAQSVQELAAVEEFELAPEDGEGWYAKYTTHSATTSVLLSPEKSIGYISGERLNNLERGISYMDSVEATLGPPDEVDDRTWLYRYPAVDLKVHFHRKGPVTLFELQHRHFYVPT